MTKPNYYLLSIITGCGTDSDKSLKESHYIINSYSIEDASVKGQQVLRNRGLFIRQSNISKISFWEIENLIPTIEIIKIYED